MKTAYIMLVASSLLTVTSYAADPLCELPNGSYANTNHASNALISSVKTTHGTISQINNTLRSGTWKIGESNTTHPGQCAQQATYTHNNGNEETVVLFTWNPQKCMASPSPKLPPAGTEGVNSIQTCLIHIPADTITVTTQNGNYTSSTLQLAHPPSKKQKAH